jgi:hypothetical protein
VRRDCLLRRHLIVFAGQPSESGQGAQSGRRFPRIGGLLYGFVVGVQLGFHKEDCCDAPSDIGDGARFVHLECAAQDFALAITRLARTSLRRSRDFCEVVRDPIPIAQQSPARSLSQCRSSAAASLRKPHKWFHFRRMDQILPHLGAY